MTARTARPGLGQDEKDEIGRQLHEARNREALFDRLAEDTDRWLPDDQLDDQDLDRLREEAAVRALVGLPKNLGKDELVKRLTQRRRDVDAHVKARTTERPYVPRKPWEPSY
jgi:hypothetical protein